MDPIVGLREARPAGCLAPDPGHWRTGMWRPRPTVLVGPAAGVFGLASGRQPNHRGCFASRLRWLVVRRALDTPTGWRGIIPCQVGRHARPTTVRKPRGEKYATTL